MRQSCGSRMIFPAFPDPTFQLFSDLDLVSDPSEKFILTRRKLYF
jgi:hypothetical protein